MSAISTSHPSSRVALRTGQAVRGFTGELSNSYETIDLLYALGRSMRDLERPERFIGMVCDRLHEHMRFGWLALKFSGERGRAGPLASKVFVRGTVPGSEAVLEEAAKAGATRAGRRLSASCRATP